MGEMDDVTANVAANEVYDLLGRNADQHDRLMMGHEPRAGDLPVGTEADENLESVVRR